MAENEQPLVRVGRVDVGQLLDRLTRAAERCGLRVENMGSNQDWPLLAMSRSVAGAPRLYLSSGVHGDEPAGPLAVLHWLESGTVTDAIDLMICPLLNPSGLAAGTRTTACGRDLNRDYAHFETVESSCHAAWLRQHGRPDVMLSLHEDYETSGVYLYEINTSGVPSRAGELLEAAARVLPLESSEIIDGHRINAPGWILHPPQADEPGWPEAIFVAQLGPQVSYTFETPSRAPLAKRIAAMIAVIDRITSAMADTGPNHDHP